MSTEPDQPVVPVEPAAPEPEAAAAAAAPSPAGGADGTVPAPAEATGAATGRPAAEATSAAAVPAAEAAGAAPVPAPEAGGAAPARSAAEAAGAAGAVPGSEPIGAAAAEPGPAPQDSASVLGAGAPRVDRGPDPVPPAQGWPAAAPTPQPGVRYDVPQDQKNLAMLSTLGMLVVSFLSPLIVFAVTNGDPGRKFVNDHAKEGLNFSIVLAIASAVTALLMLLIIGFLLVPLLVGWSLWVVIAGTIQASNGEAPHYPLVPKILK